MDAKENYNYSALVEKYADMIMRISYQRVRNKHDAEDIMQEVFVALLNAPPFSSEAHQKAWLIRAAINRSKDLLKSARRRKELPLDDLKQFAKAEHIRVFDEINSLKEKDRDLIYLFYFEGYSAKEIAAILKRTESAVMMGLSRARQKLKDLLEEKPL